MHEYGLVCVGACLWRSEGSGSPGNKVSLL